MIIQTTDGKAYNALKITNAKGVTQYIPNNPINRDLHTTFRSNLNQEKKEKYKIEEVNLSLEEASELGFAEAHQLLNPPKNKLAPKENTSMIELLMKQNQELAERLAKMEEKSSKPKKDDK